MVGNIKLDSLRYRYNGGPYLLLILNFYTHYIGNDYNILQDISQLNNRVKTHNTRQDNLKQEIEAVKAKLKAGDKSMLLGEQLMGRALDMIKQGEEKKSPQQQQKKN